MCVCVLELEEPLCLTGAHNQVITSPLQKKKKINLDTHPHNTHLPSCKFPQVGPGRATCLHVWKNSRVCLPAVMQYSEVRVGLRDIPEIAGMTEGGSGDHFLGTFLKKQNKTSALMTKILHCMSERAYKDIKR